MKSLEGQVLCRSTDPQATTKNEKQSMAAHTLAHQLLLSVIIDACRAFSGVGIPEHNIVDNGNGNDDDDVDDDDNDNDNNNDNDKDDDDDDDDVNDNDNDNDNDNVPIKISAALV